MDVVFLAPAQAEFAEAVAYYNTQRAGLGEEFAEEVQRTIARISASCRRWGSSPSAAACSRTGRNLRMRCDADCRTAVREKTARTVGWEGNGELTMRGLVRHCKGETRSNS
jgi:hypothetical protein